jgi:hypothetical protein
MSTPTELELFVVVDVGKAQTETQFDQSLVAVCTERWMAEDIARESTDYAVFARTAAPRCMNCDDGCIAVKVCEGCNGDLICKGCWAEHNEDAPCHICGQYSARDENGDLTEDGCGC